MLYDTGTTLITPETPDKLAEIIRDTWPNLYRPPANYKNEKRIRTNPSSQEENEKPSGGTQEDHERV